MHALLALLLLLLGGCASFSSSPRVVAEAEAAAPASLFPSDATILPDEAIAAILDASPRLPERVRIALLHLEHQSAGRFFGWGPYWTTFAPSTQQSLAERMVSALRRSPRVEDASYLPSFLLPAQPSIGHLREAVARFQADAVLVYRTDCQAYTRGRFFRAAEAKAFCSAEAALLDVRSGIVPFTSRSVRDFTLSQERDDAGFLETIRKAETEAFTAALEENAANLVGFLGSPG